MIISQFKLLTKLLRTSRLSNHNFFVYPQIIKKKTEEEKA